MLGKELYKVDVSAELSNERLKSLIFFYAPLIGNDATYLYQHFVMEGSHYSYEEINRLLNRVNMSIDRFEACTGHLNRYRLLKTLKQDEHYVFVVNSALTMNDFIKDDILVREFILKTSGEHYQQLIADLKNADTYKGFEDVSEVLSIKDLSDWNKDYETYLNKKPDNSYDFNTLFNISYFLKDISTLMFPMKYRTNQNLKDIATLADIYGISYDKMRNYVANAVNKSNDEFNIGQLRYSCMNARTDYQKVEQNRYDVPSINYLMSLQDGKEVTDYDKKILYNLAFKYHLKNDVINVLLGHTLKNCDNRLIENYIYPIASDLHRNDIKNAFEALERLSDDHSRKKNDDVLPTYDSSVNKQMSDEELNELLSLRGK